MNECRGICFIKKYTINYLRLLKKTKLLFSKEKTLNDCKTQCFQGFYLMVRHEGLEPPTY